MSLRQRNKARVRAQILDAAATLFAESSVETTTTRLIADRAGVSYQTLYNYFPSKSQIVHGLLEQDMTNWSKRVDSVIKHYEGDVLKTIEEMFEVSIAWITENEDKRRLWQIMTSSMFAQGIDQELITSKTVAHEHFHALLFLAQGTGQLQPGLDLHLMAHTLFSLTDYAMLRFILEDVDAETFLRTQREQIELVLMPYLQTTA